MARTSLLRLLFPSIRMLRLSVYLFCVFVVLSLLATRALYAQVKEAAHALGRELAGLSDLAKGAYVMNLNGARMSYVRVATEDSVTHVLDRVEAHCNANPGAIAQAWDEIVARHASVLAEHAPPAAVRRGAFRDEREDGGLIVCFTDDRAFGLSGFAEALERFSKTSDLSEFGKVRFAYAQRRSDGKTRLVMLWANDALKIANMFPAEGDADGSDSSVLPRPPLARRTLSAAVESMPYSLRLYDSSEDAAVVRRFYDDWMAQHGWRGVRVPDSGTTSYFAPNGYQIFLSLFVERGRTYVALTEAGDASTPPIATVDVVAQ